MSAIRVTRTEIVLSGQVWVAELAAELVRENVPEDRAELRARHVLHRICGHAGYMDLFLVDDEPPPTAERTPDERRHRRGKEK